METGHKQLCGLAFRVCMCTVAVRVSSSELAGGGWLAEAPDGHVSEHAGLSQTAVMQAPILKKLFKKNKAVPEPPAEAQASASDASYVPPERPIRRTESTAAAPNPLLKTMSDVWQLTGFQRPNRRTAVGPHCCSSMQGMNADRPGCLSPGKFADSNGPALIMMPLHTALQACTHAHHGKQSYQTRLWAADRMACHVHEHSSTQCTLLHQQVHHCCRADTMCDLQDSLQATHKHGSSSPRARPLDPGFSQRQPFDLVSMSADSRQAGLQALEELPELAEQGRTRSNERSPREEGPLRSALSKMPSMVGSPPLTERKPSYGGQVRPCTLVDDVVLNVRVFAA